MKTKNKYDYLYINRCMNQNYNLPTMCSYVYGNRKNITKGEEFKLNKKILPKNKQK